MPLCRRLRLLEQEYRAGGRCLECRERPERVLRFIPQDAHDETSLPKESHDDAGEPCPARGWTPGVTAIVEVVVQSREDVTRLEALGPGLTVGSSDC
jgi:hypothetical protein